MQLTAAEVEEVRRAMLGAMPDRCDVQRPAQAAQDTIYGDSPAAEWQPHLADVPCAYTQGGGHTRISEAPAVLHQHTLVLPHDTDVAPTDRVAEVRGPTGAARTGGPLRVEAVARRQTHVECGLVEVSW